MTVTSGILDRYRFQIDYVYHGIIIITGFIYDREAWHGFWIVLSSILF